MMVRMQIQFTEEQVVELKAAARADGISISEVVRRRVSASVPAVPPPFDAHRFGFGMYTSDVSDLSINHDEYYADAVYERKAGTSHEATG